MEELMATCWVRFKKATDKGLWYPAQLLAIHQTYPEPVGRLPLGGYVASYQRPMQKKIMLLHNATRADPHPYLNRTDQFHLLSDDSIEICSITDWQLNKEADILYDHAIVTRITMEFYCEQMDPNDPEWFRLRATWAIQMGRKAQLI